MAIANAMPIGDRGTQLSGAVVAVAVHLDRRRGDRIDDLWDRCIGVLVRRQLDRIG